MKCNFSLYATNLDETLKPKFGFYSDKTEWNKKSAATMFWRSQMQQFLFNFLAVRIPPNSNDSYPQQQQQQFVEFFGVCLITILFDFFALRLYVVASLTSSLEKRTRRIDKKIFGFKMTRMVSDEKENFQEKIYRECVPFSLH